MMEDVGKVVGRPLRNHVDASDSGLVSETSNASMPEQTASIALLPPEILSEIIRMVAAKGTKKPDVGNTLRSGRALYHAGL